MLAASSELPSNAKWSGGVLLLAAESDRDGNMGELDPGVASGGATPTLGRGARDAAG